MSISRLFTCCMSCAALIVMLVAGRTVVWDAMNYRAHVRAIDAEIALESALFVIEKLAVERGPTFSLLTRTDAADAAARQPMESARGATTVAIANLRRYITVLPDSEDTPAFAHVGALMGALGALDAARLVSERAVDEDLAKPLADRDPTITQSYAFGQFTLRERIEPLLDMLQARVAAGAPDVAAVVQIVRYAADLREIAGLQASLVTPAIAERRAFTPLELGAVDRLQGEIDWLRSQIGAAIEYVGNPPALADARHAAEAGYFTRGRAVIDPMLASGASDGHYPVKLTEFIQIVTGELRSLIALRDAANGAAIQAATRSRDAAWYNVAVSGIELIVVVALMAGLGAWFRRKVVGPLIDLTSKVEQLADGKRDIKIGLTGRRDEVGSLARAMRIFRDVLVESDRLRAKQARAQEAAEAAKLEVQAANAQLEDRVKERTKQLLATQQELIKKERLSAIGQLTATVAHELRNPLSAIRNTIFTLKEMAGDEGPALERPVARIERSVNRCRQIVDDLLDFTRTTNPKLHPTLIDSWLSEVLDEHNVPSRIVLERRLNAPEARVAIDHERFRRVLINLIDNATQAIQGDDGGDCRITVSTCTSPLFEIVVEDAGPGISPENLPKIFEPLFSTKSFGTGLGLPTVKQIVEQHGGTIVVKSELGHGTRVSIRLPHLVAEEVAA